MTRMTLTLTLTLISPKRFLAEHCAIFVVLVTFCWVNPHRSVIFRKMKACEAQKGQAEMAMETLAGHENDEGWY